MKIYPVFVPFQWEYLLKNRLSDPAKQYRLKPGLFLPEGGKADGKERKNWEHGHRVKRHFPDSLDFRGFPAGQRGKYVDRNSKIVV